MLPWNEDGNIWGTQAKYMTWLRGSLRRAWNRHPTKIKLIQKERFKMPNPNPRGRKTEVWGCKCGICRQDFIQSKCEVDHLIPAGSLKELTDIRPFVEKLLVVSTKDLRILCKECHKLVTFAERRGIPLKEARVEKKITQFKALNKAGKQSLLRSLRIPDDGTASVLNGRFSDYIRSQSTEAVPAFRTLTNPGENGRFVVTPAHDPSKSAALES